MVYMMWEDVCVCGQCVVCVMSLLVVMYMWEMGQLCVGMNLLCGCSPSGFSVGFV